MRIALKAAFTVGARGLEARVVLWVLSVCLEDTSDRAGTRHHSAMRVSALRSSGKVLQLLGSDVISDIVAAVAADTAGNNMIGKYSG